MKLPHWLHHRCGVEAHAEWAAERARLVRQLAHAHVKMKLPTTAVLAAWIRDANGQWAQFDPKPHGGSYASWLAEEILTQLVELSAQVRDTIQG